MLFLTPISPNTMLACAAMSVWILCDLTPSVRHGYKTIHSFRGFAVVAAHESPPGAKLDCVDSANLGKSPFAFFFSPLSLPPLGGVTYSNFLVSRVKVTGPLHTISVQVRHAGLLQSHLVCQANIHHSTKLTVYAYLSRHIVSNFQTLPLMRSGTYDCFILSRNTSYS